MTTPTLAGGAWSRNLRYAGPGIIWAMSAIGQTHVVLATYAGARFGFELLWMVVLAHVLAYPVFEYGARYALATGESLNHAYLQMRRARWIVGPFFAVTLLTLPFLILASLGSVTASILLAAFPAPGFDAWCIAVAVFTAVILFAGAYRWLERLNLWMAAVLLVGVAVAFALSPPAPAELAQAFVPTLPAGALVTLVALMRLPSDAGSSVMLSTWALRRREEWLAQDGPHGAMRGGLLGLRAGYALSLAVAVVFLCLGAVVLHPRGVDLEGVGLALELSHIFTETVGAWTFPLFITIAFVALFSGYYAVADGVPRMFEDLVLRVGGREPGSENSVLRVGYTAVILLGGLAIAIGVERPVFLVVLAVSVGLIGYPLIYALNLYAVTRMVAPEHRPHALGVLVAALGVAFGLTGAVLLFGTRVLGWGS